MEENNSYLATLRGLGVAGIIIGALIAAIAGVNYSSEAAPWLVIGLALLGFGILSILGWLVAGAVGSEIRAAKSAAIADPATSNEVSPES